jgi:hypothetical protein
VVETNETFQVLLENVSNATVAKGVGIGTIVNDDAGASPTLLVGDQWISEGNAGSKTANFTVQLSQPAATDVITFVPFATAIRDPRSRCTANTAPAGCTRHSCRRGSSQRRQTSSAQSAWPGRAPRGKAIIRLSRKSSPPSAATTRFFKR